MQLQVRDLTFDVVDEGPRDGPVVVLLHGFPQTSSCWRLVLPALVGAGYRVVAPDQRGYSPGARPARVDAYAMPALVQDVLDLLDEVGAAGAHVVGHDWGAAVAWQLAARHPERVRTLTAVSVPHPAALSAALRTDPDQQERSRYIAFIRSRDDADEVLLRDDAARLREFFTGAGPDVDVESAVRRMQQPGALAAALGWYRAARRQDTADLPAVTVPTLYVWSDGDLALGETAARAGAEHVAGPYRFLVLHGVSHWVPEEAADVLAGLLVEHLDG